MITMVGNLKGGTGKSTIAFNLAVWLKQQHCQSLCFDLDPQQTLKDLATVRADIGVEPLLEVETSVEKFIKQARQLSQEILVDVGASDMTAMRLALRYAHRVVIPLVPSQADVWATQRFLSIIKKARAGLHTNIQVLAVLNRADDIEEDSIEAEQALDALRIIQRLPIRLYYRSLYRQALAEGMAVFELQPNGNAAQEVETLANLLYGMLV